MYISIMGSKGGVGKSTIAKAIYLELSSKGRKVGGMDGDTQKHFQKLLDSSTSHEDNDHIIIDTTGVWSESNQELITEMLKHDGLIIVPFLPSDDDVKEALMMARRLDGFDMLNRTVFVMNRVLREFDNDIKLYSAK